MARLEFDFRFKPGEPGARRRAPGEPLRVLLLGDFSGRGTRDELPFSRTAERAIPVDAAHLDRAFERCEARLRIPVASGGTEQLEIRSSEDLHPDALLQATKSFEEPLRLRRALAQGAGQAEILGQVRALLQSRARSPVSSVGNAASMDRAASASSNTAPSSESSPSESAGDTLSRLLGGAAASPSTNPAPSTGPLQAILARAVKPHLAPTANTERDGLLSELDQLLSRELQQILTDPAYLSLEATWRAAERVIRGLDTDELIEISLFDLTLADLKRAFHEGSKEPERAELLRRLGNDAQYGCFAAALAFGPEEIAELAGLSSWAVKCGAFLLADASPSLLGITSPDAALEPKLWNRDAHPALWHALRTSPLGRHVSLVFPRVLLRLPYGKATDSIDTLPFEEAPHGDQAASAVRVYGSGALAVCEMLGRGYREHELEYLQAFDPELADLPAYTYLDAGEKKLVAATEVQLSERAVRACLAEGITPLLARRDRSSVQVPQLCSIASPAAPLAECV